MFFLRQLLFFLCLCLAAPLLWAQEPEPLLRDHDRIFQLLDQVEEALGKEEITESELRDWLTKLSSERSLAQDCVNQQETKFERVNAGISSLGEPMNDAPQEVRSKRQDLEKQKSVIDKQLAQCRLLLLRADELSARINGQIKAMLSSMLLARGPNFLTVVFDHWSELPEWLGNMRRFMLEQSGLELLDWLERGWLLLLLCSGILIGYRLRQNVKRRLAIPREEGASLSERLFLAAQATYAHFMPHILGTALAGIYVFVVLGEIHPIPFINVLAYGFPVYYLLLGSLLIFLAPKAPGPALSDHDPALMKALGRRLRILLALLFVIYLVMTSLIVQRPSDAALLLARDIVLTLMVLNLIWAVWLLGRFPGAIANRWLRLLAYALLFAVLLAEWLGYRNLALVGLRGVTGSMLALGFILLFSRLLSGFYDDLEVGRKPVHQRIRAILKVSPGEKIGGLVWMRFFTSLTLWVLMFLALLQAWDLSDTTLQSLRGRVSEGISIGSLQIKPLRLIMALLVVAGLLAVTGWFRDRLGGHWLLKTQMDRGAREALVTITGYVGTTLAILVGLSVTGMDFSNLAIIFGALSVGIGFGLQNIVNNFVSGLILLFERPVKTGDWVVVGSTEGYVKRISIRSTQIQTFDRADVIVPNSDLISNQVTNWMLYDTMGRIRVPIGVAYGSDSQKVKDILLTLADEHPRIVKMQGVPPPRVLFLGFGDSSLNFELRAHIENIDERLQVISDINFSIDTEFRTNGIEIPFPQRDLHVRSLPTGFSAPAADDKSLDSDGSR